MSPDTELTLTTPWVTKPVIMGSTKPLHIIFLGHTLVATTTMGILGASRGNHGREEQF